MFDKRRLRSIIKEAVATTPGSNEPTVFTSDLDPNLFVVIIYPKDPRYSQVEPIFDQKGHAFLANETTMVVDGKALGEPWFTTDHLTVIQAHELGHKLAGHVGISSHDNPKMEKEADWLGYNILKNRNMPASSLHEEEYIARYNNHPKDDDHKMEHLRKFTD